MQLEWFYRPEEAMGGRKVCAYGPRRARTAVASARSYPAYTSACTAPSVFPTGASVSASGAVRSPDQSLKPAAWHWL